MNDSTRFYAVDNEGNIVAESDNKDWLQLHLRDILSDEEIADREIEIIED